MLSMWVLVVLVGAPAAAPDTLTGAQRPTAAVVVRLGELYDAFEYDELLRLADVALTRSDLTESQRLEVYRLQASVKAVTRDIVEAEKPFRLLLRANPAYELPANSPPKIMAVFRKVQVEEQALARSLSEVQRGRLISRLKLSSELPTTGRGGLPVAFSLAFRDEANVIEGVRVGYRRQGTSSYSTLALSRNDAGLWSGTLPGELTASETDYRLEYFVETFDAEGPLLRLGSSTDPRPLEISKGQVRKERFAPVPRAVFFTALGATAVAGALAGGFRVALAVTQGEYRTFVASMTDFDGAVTAPQRSRGAFLAEATNASLIGLGVLAVVTIVLATLTAFD